MQIHENFPIAEKLYYQIGGTVRYFIEAKTREDVIEGIHFINENKIGKVFICSTGSNLIFTDEFYDGAVLAIASDHTTETVSFQAPDTMTVFAGNLLDSAITFGFENRLVGLQWSGGLPGSVGAAVRGNVGAFGGEIKDVITAVEIIEKSEDSHTHRTLMTAELDFSYRTSYIKLHKDAVVLSATFRLTPASDEELAEAKRVYEKNKEYRRLNHPLEYPNCGSVFKNIAKKDEVEKVLAVWPDIEEQVATKWHGKVSMGYCIKRFGLSGYRFGNAQVSEKHANFIVNLGGAKAAEVKQIIKEIQNTTFLHFGFAPEVEVEIVE